MVGAPFEDASKPHVGAVYSYSRDAAGLWHQTGKVYGAMENDGLGSTVAFGDTDGFAETTGLAKSDDRIHVIKTATAACSDTGMKRRCPSRADRSSATAVERSLRMNSGSLLGHLGTHPPASIQAP